MHVLFVCTGNICRSPFAEALARRIADDPTASFTSAGTAARENDPASPIGTLVAGRDFGADTTRHRATSLTADVLGTADIVFAMEEAHLSAVLGLDPKANVELLSLDGSPIPDPYGGDEDAYRASYSLIRRALAARLRQPLQG